MRVLNRWLAVGAEQAPRLHNTGDLTILEPGIADHRDARQSLAHLALDGAQLIGTDIRGGLRIGPGPECGGRFLDDSPAGQRRWCSMQICGNRRKATAHRMRRRAT